MVSSDEINRRLEARRRGVKYQDPKDRRTNVRMESSNSKECPSCHTQNPSTAKFCVGCGEKLETPDQEPERGFSPEIKGPDEPAPEKPIQRKHKITPRPDDFSKPSKLEPIIPPEPEPTPEVEPETTPETEPKITPKPEPPTTKEPELKPDPQKPPHINRPEDNPIPEPKVETTTTPELVNTEPGVSETKEKSNLDPVERIKKAKELLDLGAITQEDFDKIKNKYLDEI